MLTAVLLELEGVLVETAGPRAAALERALAEEGVAGAPARALAAHGARAPWADLAAPAARAGVALDATALDLVVLRAQCHLAATLSAGVSLAPGARAAVERLAARVPVAVVTRATRQEADLLLAHAGLHALLAFVVAGDDAAAKPSPAPYARARQRLDRRLGARARAGSIVALEDARAGIESAAAAGLAVVAVGDVPAHDALRASGAIDTLQELTVDQLERAAGIAAGHSA